MKKFMFAAIAALVMVSVSNVFASSKMVSNAQVAPVDTVAPNAPSDTPVQPQAAAEDSTQQENATEETPATTEDSTQQETTEQKETTEQQTAELTAIEQQTIAE